MRRKLRNQSTSRSNLRLPMLLAMMISPTLAFGSECSPALVEALRTTFGFHSEFTKQSSSYHEMCEQRLQSGQTTAFLGSIGFGQASESMANACLAGNAKYFESHRVAIDTSYVPDAAIPILAAACSGKGVYMEVSEMQGVITGRMSYVGRDGALIEELTVSPKDALNCNLPEKNYRLEGDVKIFSCTRNKQNRDAVSFVLHTTKGDAEQHLTAIPDIKVEEYEWMYTVGVRGAQREDYIQCGHSPSYDPKGTFIDFISVGAAHHTSESKPFGSGNPVEIKSACRKAHGATAKKVIIDGVRLPLPDER